MYWKVRHTVWSYVKLADLARSIRDTVKGSHVPPKLVITTPWKALCVDLIGPYTLTGKDRSRIYFMCLTMIDPPTSWFEIVELPSVDKTTFPTMARVKRSHVQKSSIGGNQYLAYLWESGMLLLYI